MGYKPNCVVYLCAGTGLDYNNSIWMYKFAFPYEQFDTRYGSLWSRLFEFIKAHSVAQGYWYMSDVRPHNGVIRVGRTPLQNGVEKGQAGLGSAELQIQLDDVNTVYADTLRSIDYVVFANDNGGTWYAFVDRVEYVNRSVALIHYTIDAILTYQAYFYFGKCLVERDMQQNERGVSWDGPIQQTALNYLPEPLEPDESQYIFQHCKGETEFMKAVDLGAYQAKFVTTDVKLSADKISSNQWLAGIPAFVPPNTVKLVSNFDIFDRPIQSGDIISDLGIGLYYVNPFKDPEDIEPFVKLGSFNAFEHILYTYSVPKNIVKFDALNTLSDGIGVYGINLSQDADNSEKYYNAKYKLAFPSYYDDSQVLNLYDDNYTPPTLAYIPLNVKTHFAPYNYYCISDKQGNSLEIVPQAINGNVPASNNIIYDFDVAMSLTAMPNILSMLYIPNIEQFNGSQRNPLSTLWQIPAYTMTPNNSGYMLNNIAASQNMVLGIVTVPIGAAMSIAGGTVSSIASLAGILGSLSGGAAGFIAGSMGAASTRVGAGVLSTAGSTVQSFGTNALLKAGQEFIAGQQNKTYGLPKANGGLPEGKSFYTLSHVGYEVYRVHLKQSLMKLVDQFFTIYGYNQNAWRYPHINTRRRWCFVKCSNVNIMPNGAGAYNAAGIPSEYQQQIIDRMKAGVTFWNLRRQLYGSDDDNSHPLDSINWDDPIIQGLKNCQFIRNYGNAPDSDVAKDNCSFLGGYADYYSDELQPQSGITN